jgi:hypothetical protein
MAITKRMTWDEIRARYPDQWVVMVDHDWPGDDAPVSTARVLTTGPERADALRRARSALEAYECYGCRFTGEVEHAAVPDGRRWREAAPRRVPSGEATGLTSRTSRALSDAVSLGERLTWDEIRERYPDCWVVMVDHDWQAQNITELKTARVLATGATRAEAKAHARPMLDTYRAWGCHFTGEPRASSTGSRPWLINSAIRRGEVIRHSP